MFNWLRSGANLYKQACRLGQSGALPMGGTTVYRNASGLIPDGYEQYHLKPEDHVQPLDNTDPLTPEKHAELAAKYNLRPEDYVPMNDPDLNVGDYPQLPLECSLARDPFYDWDSPYYRRNFGEPILWDLEVFGPLHLETSPMIFDRPQAWKPLLGFAVGMAILYGLGEMYPSFLPRAPKQYPEYFPGDDKEFGYYSFFEKGDGLDPKIRPGKQLTNYTFEAHPWDPEAH